MTEDTDQLRSEIAALRAAVGRLEGTNAALQALLANKSERVGLEPSASEIIARLEDFIDKVVEQQNVELRLAILMMLAAATPLLSAMLAPRFDAEWANEALIPLRNLEHALADLCEGARPELLKPHKLLQTAGRPGDTSRHIWHGAAARCADFLKPFLSREAAARWVADELKVAGLYDPESRKTSWKKVARWRDEVGGRAPPSLTQLYTAFDPQRPLVDVDDAKAEARRLLRFCRLLGF